MARAKRHHKKAPVAFLHRSPPRALGASPGTLQVDPDAPKSTLEIIVYGDGAFNQVQLASVDELGAWLGKGRIVWLNICGLGDLEVLQKLGKQLDLHPLALEDVVNVNQRAKVETFAPWTFIVARMAPENEEKRTEQVSFFLKPGMVVTFQEYPGDSFEPVRERLRHNAPRLHSKGADYLTYALLDALIDAYFPVLDHCGDRLEELEETVLHQPSEAVLEDLHRLRRHLISLRKTIIPHRDAIHLLLRELVPPFTEETQVFLRDCYDHALRLIELLESYRELAVSLMEVYLSTLGQKSNEVMMMLTMIATIFIPLSFLAGLYGMNFNTDHPWNMPELSSPYGYPALLVVMMTIAVVLLLYFRRKGWL